MNIDFDRLRLDGAKHFNSLIGILNNNCDYRNGVGEVVEIYKSGLEDSIDGLRNFIAALLSIEDKEPGPIKTVWTQLKVFGEEEGSDCESGTDCKGCE